MDFKLGNVIFFMIHYKPEVVNSLITDKNVRIRFPV